MEIKINNWEKFQERRDLKSMTWFRLECRTFADEKLFELENDQKWFWVFLLSLCGFQNRGGCIKCTGRYLAQFSGLSTNDLRKALYALENMSMITVVNAEDALFSTNPCRSNTDLRGNVSNRTEQNRTEHIISNKLLISASLDETSDGGSKTGVKNKPIENIFPELEEIPFEIKKQTQERWLKLYESDKEWISREIIKAVGYYHQNPRKSRKSARGWSLALSNWFERGWERRSKKQAPILQHRDQPKSFAQIEEERQKQVMENFLKQEPENV